MLGCHRRGGYRRGTYVEANNARFWVEDEGDGPAVVFFHFGLGDSRIFDPERRALADRFRCVAYDRRFFGRTEAPAEPYAPIDDAVAVLDALGIERAALVGLSGGGKLALDVAFARPERAWALVHIAAPVSGLPWGLSEEQEAAYEAAATPEAEMEVDLQVWAPLGAEERFRDLLQNARPEEGESPRSQAVSLEEVRVPTLVITARHDPPALQESGREAARRIPAAQLVEVDSDHYLTLREPERVTALLRNFLEATRPR